MVLRSLNFYLLGISALIDRISKEEVAINENLFAGCSKLADFLAQEKYEPVGNETKRQRWKNICRVYDNEGTCRQFLFYSFVFWRYFAPRPITIGWPNIYKRIERSIDDFAVSKSQRFPSRRGIRRLRKKQDTIVNLNGQYTEAQRRKMLGTFVTFLPRNRNTTFESHNRSQNLWNSRSNDRFFVTRIEANGVCLAEYLLDVEKSGQKFDGICV